MRASVAISAKAANVARTICCNSKASCFGDSHQLNYVMLKFKKLFTTALLSCACVFSFAQPPSHSINGGAQSTAKSTGAKAAKAKHINGKSKNHAKKIKKTRHPVMKNAKRLSAKKANNAPIGLQAF